MLNSRKKISSIDHPGKDASSQVSVTPFRAAGRDGASGIGYPDAERIQMEKCGVCWVHAILKGYGARVVGGRMLPDGSSG